MFAHSWDEINNTTHKKAKATNRAPNTKILLTWHELSPCQVSYPCMQPKTCVACVTWNSCHISHSCLCLLVVFLSWALFARFGSHHDGEDWCEQERTNIREDALRYLCSFWKKCYWNKQALERSTRLRGSNPKCIEEEFAWSLKNPRFATMPHFLQFFQRRGLVLLLETMVLVA